MQNLFNKPVVCFRMAVGVVAFGSATAVGAAFILEHGGWMEPCALCWTQRFVMFAVSFSAIILWLLNPITNRTQKISIGLLTLFSFLGVAVAIRHMYVIINPNVVSCGPNVTDLINYLPWRDVLMTFITGQSACTEVSKLLGIPMPIWSLSSFLTFSALPLLAHIKEKRTK